MIDRKHIGLESAPHTVEVEKGRLRFFAKATGQTDPVYTDVEAARAAGFDNLPVPPTFLLCLDLETPNPFELFDHLGVDISRILHGEQDFRYFRGSCAGDSLTFRTRITDIYDKKGGALEFIVQTTDVSNQHGEKVAEFARTVVVRN